MKVRKLVVSDGRSERELLLVGTIVVGRDPSCQLNDLDPLLSRRHAEFVPTSKGVTVRDLKSRNGILVNGDKVPEHALKPGDVIQLGHLHVRYVEELVVRSAEDHSRVRAKTETGIEVPTMAQPARAASAQVASAPIASPAAASHAPAPPNVSATAPTQAAPVVSSIDETDLDVTVAPLARAAASAPRHAAPVASRDELDIDATVAPVHRPASPPSVSAPPLDQDVNDFDATVAPASHRSTASHPAPPVPSSNGDDLDSTRVPWAKGTAVAEDVDATIAPSNRTFDETRLPAASRPAPAANVTEARVVANINLVVTEASPTCQTVIGARPDTIIGGQLADAIARTLRFVATGDGPSALSLSIARATSGNTITVTFKAGQTENHS